MMHTITCPNCGHPAATVTISAGEITTSQTPPGWLQDFLTARCQIEPGAVVPVTDFRAAYAQWAKRVGAPDVSARRLGIEVLRLRNIKPSRDNAQRYYQGIRLS